MLVWPAGLRSPMKWWVFQGSIALGYACMNRGSHGVTEASIEVVVKSTDLWFILWDQFRKRNRCNHILCESESQEKQRQLRLSSGEKPQPPPGMTPTVFVSTTYYATCWFCFTNCLWHPLNPSWASHVFKNVIPRTSTEEINELMSQTRQQVQQLAEAFAIDPGFQLRQVDILPGSILPAQKPGGLTWRHPIFQWLMEL